MATSFETIRTFVRGILLDTDPNCYVYSDSALNGQIRWVIVFWNDSTVQESDTPEQFTITLTAKQQATLVLTIAKNIIAPQHDTFSYRTPITSVVRKGGIRQMYAHLEQQLAALNGGSIACASETDMTAIFNSLERWTDAYTEASSTG